MAQTTEAKSVQASSEAAGQITTLTTVGSATSQVLMSGALSQVWGLINGLQLFVHIPLFQLSLPANAQTLVDQLITIATFDLVEPEVVFGWMLEFPEEDENALDPSFTESGYESAYMINLLGMGFIVFIAILLVILCILLLHPLRKHSRGLSQRLDTVSGSIFWGFWLRFLIEDSLIALIAVFCDQYSIQANSDSDSQIQPSNPATAFKLVDISILILFGLALFALPFFVVVFYLINFEKLTDKNFMGRYGEVYAGLNPERKSTIAFSVFFLLRRYIFAITICLTLFWQVWFQIATQLVLSMGSACFLLNFTPFEDALPLDLEIFNEVTTIMLLYHVTCFTEFIPSALTHVLIGYSFLALMLGNMAVHLFFLSRSSIKGCMYKYRKRRHLQASVSKIETRGAQRAKEKNMND